VNQEGWDAAAEGVAVSRTGEVIDLRLDWADVEKKLASANGALEVQGSGADVDEEAVLRDFSLSDLDPTQRAFADRVLKWAKAVVRT